MAVQVSYPGVYVEEFTPGAPIEGVGTSTAAFLGPLAAGPLNEPTKIASWDVFRQTFGGSPLDGAPYTWYAARGFFENGGTVCYVTRVSNASYDRLVLGDASGGDGKPTIELRSREVGKRGGTIKVKVEQTSAVSAESAKLYRPTATISNASGSAIAVTSADDASHFRPGDVITWSGSTEAVDVVVLRVDGQTLRLKGPLAQTYNTGTVRLADLKRGSTTFRATGADKLAAGSTVHLRQDPGGGGAVVEDYGVVKLVSAERLSPSLTTYRVELRQALNNNYSLAADTTLESLEFTITVTVTSDGQTKTTVYDQLAMDPNQPRYYVSVMNADPTGPLVASAVEPPNTTPLPNNRPKKLDETELTGGQEDRPGSLTPADFIAALAQLDRVDDVNIVCVPDSQDAGLQMALVDHCTRLGDRVAVLDSRRGAPLFGTGSVDEQRDSVTSERGHAALYYPWLWVQPASGRELVLVPPSGHVAGVYARTDATRGVHKAPAGSEAIVSGAVGVERTMSDVEQGQLNLRDVNVIRVFGSGGRPTVMGARTTSSNASWRYINVRRLFNYLEESIQEGIFWAVFEPNNLSLWQQLKRTIGEFLTRVWRDGALFGVKASDAFYVRIDEALNPFSEQELGRLNIECGVRPVYPAEFIILRFGIWEGGSEVSEG